jgi:hypothetical protein
LQRRRDSRAKRDRPRTTRETGDNTAPRARELFRPDTRARPAFTSGQLPMTFRPSPGDDRPPPVNILRLQLRRGLLRSVRLYGRIRAVLRRYRPAGTGLSETAVAYDYEARMILQRLFWCHTEADVHLAVRAVLRERCDAKNVFSTARSAAAAEAIWKLWKERP